jgi:hypothetical protein
MRKSSKLCGSLFIEWLSAPSDSMALVSSRRALMTSLGVDHIHYIIGTGEHGVGVGKKDFLTQELGEGTVELMKTIKRAVDPRGLLNPGKVSYGRRYKMISHSFEADILPSVISRWHLFTLIRGI